MARQVAKPAGPGALPRLRGRLQACGARYIGYGGQVRGRPEHLRVRFSASLLERQGLPLHLYLMLCGVSFAQFDQVFKECLVIG